MPEQIQKILNRILEWWKKFDIKQKAVILSATAVVVVALIILGVVVSQPSYEDLYVAADAKEASEIKKILDSDSSINYKVSDDGLRFQVESSDVNTAEYLLADNNKPSMGYDISNVVDGSFSRTEADKTKMYKLYLEERFKEKLEMMDNIDLASVTLNLPNDDGTILSKEENASAAVVLRLNGTMDEDQAYSIAQLIATQIGNKNTDGVTILDTSNNLLFSGLSSDTSVGAASTQLSYRSKMENNVKQRIKDTFMKSNVFSNVEVGVNLDIDFSTTDYASHKYSPADGQETGMISSKDDYSSVSQGGSGGVPGTDSNDDTTYQTQDNDYTSSEITESQVNYQNNEEITSKKNNGGNIVFENSSVAIVATRYVVYDEEKMKSQGLLDDMTFDEFVAQNNETKVIEPEENYVGLIAKATGIAEDNVQILCQEQPEFVYSEGNRKTLTDILQIVLTVLIFALLGFVVFRSTRSQKEAEMEPELSVESLLEATADNGEELEDIGYNEKSETRILIEKFVDENPDAVALLLRNWINEDWE